MVKECAGVKITEVPFSTLTILLLSPQLSIVQVVQLSFSRLCLRNHHWNTEIDLTRLHTPLMSITLNATLSCIHLSSNSMSDLLFPLMLLTHFVPKILTLTSLTPADGKPISLNPHPLQRMLPSLHQVEQQ